MVFKLKEFHNNSPGFVIFSHKEFIKFSRYKTFNKILNTYKENYFFGIHWGASFENTQNLDFNNIDLNFCYPEQLPDLKDQKILPFTTRSFIPSEIFNNEGNIQKEFEVIAVTRKVNAKYNRDLFNIYKKLIERNPHIKLLILVSDLNYVKSNYDHLFDENFKKILGDYNNKNVELITFNELPDQKLVAEYLKRSKVFLFTSRKEGVAKVTAEAALCDLPVLVYKNFFGGAKVGINSKYLFEYDSIKSAVNKVNKFLRSDNRIKSSHTQVATDELNDNKNLENLEIKLRNFYNSNGLLLLGELDTFNLKNRMNSFLKELPDLYVSENNDLKSLFALNNYFENLCIGNFKLSKKHYWFDFKLKIKCKF